MKISTLSAAAAALSQSRAVLGRAVPDPAQTFDLDSADTTELGRELSELLGDSLTWLEEEDGGGAKVPGKNPLSLCQGNHGNDAGEITLFNMDPLEPAK